MTKMIYIIIASSRDIFIWTQSELKHLEVLKLLADTIG